MCSSDDGGPSEQRQSYQVLYSPNIWGSGTPARRESKRQRKPGTNQAAQKGADQSKFRTLEASKHHQAVRCEPAKQVHLQLKDSHRSGLVLLNHKKGRTPTVLHLKFSLLIMGILLNLWKQLCNVLCGSRGSFPEFEKKIKEACRKSNQRCYQVALWEM